MKGVLFNVVSNMKGLMAELHRLWNRADLARYKTIADVGSLEHIPAPGARVHSFPIFLILSKALPSMQDRIGEVPRESLKQGTYASALSRGI
jgi:hypothetical protein